MYGSDGEVWRGFAKNADEGMATPLALPLWTALLLAPVGLLALLLSGASTPLPAVLLAGLVFAAPLLHAVWFGYPLFVVPLHPLGLLVLVAIQWQALVRRITGRSVAWKGRPAEVSS